MAESLQGDDPQQNQANNPVEPGHNIATDPLGEKQKERESLYSNLMDKMEKSVSEKEQYFVKFGDKNKGKDGKTDTRALLLIKPVMQEGGRNLHIAVTRDGGKGLRYATQTQGEGIKESIERYLRIPDPAEEDVRNDTRSNNNYHPSQLGFMDNGHVIINDPKFYFKSEFPDPNASFEMSLVGFDTVTTAIQESQAAAKIPLFVEQQKIEDGKKLMDVIDKLPPKQ